MIFRFLGMLFNLVASKSKSPNVLEISKNPLPTLVITFYSGKLFSKFDLYRVVHIVKMFKPLKTGPLGRTNR